MVYEPQEFIVTVLRAGVPEITVPVGSASREDHRSGLEMATFFLLRPHVDAGKGGRESESEREGKLSDFSLLL